MITENEVQALFDSGFDCSQIVLAEVSEELGMTREEAYRVAACFGIGMAQEGVCGAATGAMMALGIKFGNDAPNDFRTKMRLFELRDEFIRRFKEINGKVNCPELIGVKVHTLKETALAEPGTFDKCPLYCINSIRILKELLTDRTS